MPESTFTSHRGFSLVELVTVATRFTSPDTFADHAARDQLISSYRYAQQRAMYDHGGNCYSLIIDANGFGPRVDDGNGNPDSIRFIGPVQQTQFSGDFSDISATVQTVYFDGLGNALTGSCSGAVIASPLTVTIFNGGSASVALEIYPSGYVRPI